MLTYFMDDPRISGKRNQFFLLPSLFLSRLRKISTIASQTKQFLSSVKFKHFEKAKKFQKISHFFWNFLVVVSNLNERFFQIFVAFSQYLNFRNVVLYHFHFYFSKIPRWTFFLLEILAFHFKANLRPMMQNCFH